MGKKIIISERQLGVIAGYISETMGVIPSVDDRITLSLMKLAGFKLTGHNLIVAMDALENPEIIDKLKNIISDSREMAIVLKKIGESLPKAAEMIRVRIDAIAKKIIVLGP